MKRNTDTPTWYTEESHSMLSRGYLLEGETVNDAILRVATASSKNLKRPDLLNQFYNIIHNGWISLSSPIWANFGTERGLPISCFGTYVEDSVEGITDALAEVIMQTKFGGGTSSYFGNIRPRGAEIKDNGMSSGAVSFMGMFDNAMDTISQGSVRRGAHAVYMDIDHKDIGEFLTIKDHSSTIQSLFTGVSVPDYWMQSMIDGDKYKRSIWAKVIRSRKEKGIPYILYSDTINKNKPEVYKDKNMTIYSSNLCVTGDTKILTKNGYKEIETIVNEYVDVWNGVEWSNVEIKQTSQDAKVFDVKLDNHIRISATNEHKWYVQDNGIEIEKRTHELNVGDVILKHKLEHVEHGNKELDKSILWSSYDTPSTDYSIDSRLWWLSKLFDSAGRYNTDEIHYISLRFGKRSNLLYDIPLMLQEMGVHSDTIFDEIGYKLTIKGNELNKLIDLGFSQNRYHLIKKESIDNDNNNVKILSVTENDTTQPTYCATEPKRNRLVFNGVLTGNCSEIALPTNRNESFICCLLSMNLEKYDEWKDTNTIELATYLLDSVITDFIKKTKGMKHMKTTRNFAKAHRAIGLGVLGYHSYLQSKNIPFDSVDAEDFNIEVFKSIKDKSYKASEALAKEYGEPSILKGYGRRNTTLMAVAPTTSSASILGQASPSIEPFASNYYKAGLAKGNFMRKNKYLEDLLESKGKNTKAIWEGIMFNDGSVQHLDFLTDHEKSVFKTFIEIDPNVLLSQASDRQEYIDQTQSLNLKIHPDTPIKTVNKLMIDAWKLGIPTLYYLRSVSTTKEHANSITGSSCCEA